MSYATPHFDPDVFVSYSHGDPRGAGDSPLKAWTHELIRSLEKQIQALDTEFDDLQIWMDAQIDPTAHLTEDLKAKVSRSCVLIVVMSKRYLASSWCKDELEWFRSQITGRSGDLGRVFVIRAQDTDVKAWPDFLCDERGHEMPGFWFHDRETGFPLGWHEVPDKDASFRKEMSRLHLALTRRLRELRERAEKRALETQSARAPRVPAAGPRRIYLHAGPEAEAARAEIREALMREGVAAVTAQAPAGRDLAGWQSDRRTLTEAAKRCDALILLRADDGEQFENEFWDIGVDERGQIGDARGAALPCAILDRTGADFPVDPSAFDIATFDVRQEGWQAAFRQWLDEARIGAAGTP